MAFTNDQLNDIFDRSGGECHICGKRLAFKNYGRPDARAAWEVDHSKPRSRGGTDRLANLLPACITCNRAKGGDTTRKARSAQGRSRSPMSTRQREVVRRENTVAGVLGGAAVGGFLAGPVGAALGALAGGIAGSQSRPR